MCSISATDPLWVYTPLRGCDFGRAIFALFTFPRAPAPRTTGIKEVRARPQSAERSPQPLGIHTEMQSSRAMASRKRTLKTFKTSDTISI